MPQVIYAFYFRVRFGTGESWAVRDLTFSWMPQAILLVLLESALWPRGALGGCRPCFFNGYLSYFTSFRSLRGRTTFGPTMKNPRTSLLVCSVHVAESLIGNVFLHSMFYWMSLLILPIQLVLCRCTPSFHAWFYEGPPCQFANFVLRWNYRLAPLHCSCGSFFDRPPC